MNGTRICIADGCDRPHYCKGYCTLHYQRFNRNGILTARPLLPERECAIDGCWRPALTLDRTLCTTHYNRNKRGADLNAPIREVRKSRGVCIVDGCEALDRGPHGYCPKHWGRIRNNGSPDIVQHQRDRVKKLENHPAWTGDTPTYNAAHQRIKAALGRASMEYCVDCGKRAAQWSYTHDDPNGLTSGVGSYSSRLEFYVPRCVSCHKRFDLARKKNI